MGGSIMRPMVTRRNFLKGIGLLGASAALAACAPTQQGGGQSASSSASASPLLAIIHTNDTHGHDVAVEGTADTKGNFSMAAVAALKAEWQQKGYDVLLVDAGDATQGMPIVDTVKGSSAIDFMNACGYDLMTVGNHDFDWGVDALAANEKAANFPFLSANVLDKQTGELRFTANKVVQLSDGTKVGLFGLTTPATATTSDPKNAAGFEFLRDDKLFQCAQEQVDELRKQGCDLVVCVGHLGNKEASGGTSKDLLGHVTGIDLFIDAHDHDEVCEEVSGTLLVETGCYLHNIGVVVIDKGTPDYQPLAAGSYDGIDSSVQAIIDEQEQRVKSEMAVVLGSTPFLLNGERSPGVRTQETNLGDFFADALRWTASQELGRQVDAGLINGGGIRASLGAGDITLGRIKEVMPFSNDVAVINVTGAQLLEAIEAACQTVGKEKGIGAFPQVSGISYAIDASVPYEEGPAYPGSTYSSPAAVGARISIADVGGRAFDANATYSIATISFLCDGGDTYYAFKQASEAEKPTTFGFDYEAFTSYLVTACNHVVPDQYAEPQGRITITGLA
ncbi:MAG TPA: multifunctional 2',3'-cyclic-nucleotide 2'-phosphodiesterase/5'-nucleotidase/3'-nucleotidase [Eggerthellaceae bacterium]|nr:multifunctional 2',3'-cyclic-nucleotide 2'-phosphodiesterase/5'-nucleotidase/3'-nucleotidase [Eggerthellaceae bacterium]